MVAPSIKSGTGHSQITDWTSSSNVGVLDSAANGGDDANSNIGSHETGTTYACVVVTPGTASSGATLYGRLKTFTNVNCGAEGTVILCHIGIPSQQDRFQTATVANAGVVVTLQSTSGNYRRWVCDGKDSQNPLFDYGAVVIDPRHTTSQYASAGTLNTGAIGTTMVHFKTGSAAYTGRTLRVGSQFLVKPYTVINGDSGNPGVFGTVLTNIQASYLRNMPATGNNTILRPYLSIHIGDGSTATYFSDSGKTIIFPSTASGASVQVHAPNGHFGLYFNGSGADTCNLTNCTILGPHYFRMSGIGSDVNNVTGCAISNATDVVLSARATIASTTFTNCATIPLTSGPTITSMSVVGTSGTYGVDCGTATSLANISFTAAGSSDYAIKISPTGTSSFTVTNCTFSGYAAGKKIYVNDANPAHTITISGSGLALADISTAGAVISVPATTTTVTHTGLQNGTRYRIYNVTAATELANAVVSGTGFTEPFTSGISNGDVIQLTTTYQSGTTVKWGGAWVATATVGGTMDFSANTPDTITEFGTWGVDGSTVTECSSDYANIEVEISTGASTLDRRRILAFIAYAMTTSSGIANWFGLLNILDASNVIIDQSIADMNWVNTHASQHVVLTQTGIWIRREDGAALLFGSGPGLTMEVSPVYTVSAGSGLTGSESAHLLSIPTNTATSTALQTVDDNVDAIKTTTDAIQRIVRNKTKTDPATGVMTVYADDGTTPLYTADVFNDADGTTPYDGTAGINRRDRLA